jgi:hypothetical protein
MKKMIELMFQRSSLAEEEADVFTATARPLPWSRGPMMAGRPNEAVLPAVRNTRCRGR